MRYVIIGGGIAGTTAAEELRKLDQKAEIILISSEHHALYSRVLLTPYLVGKVPRERVFLKKESWYTEQNIEWITGEEVTKIDVQNMFVELSDQREITYDKLLIATGAEVKLIEEDCHGVSYLRTLDDADHLMELLRALPAHAQGGIYGGGFIACEYLNIFHRYGIKTTIAFRGSHMWSRALSIRAGEIINAHLEKNGVEVIPNAPSIETNGEKTIESFTVHGKTIPCQILGIGVGIAPDLSVMKEAGIEVNQGVLCNAFMETNVPNVFAVGDVTEFYDERYERHLMTGNWMSAQTQGRVVSKTMHGEHTKFNLVSSYSAEIIGLDVIFIGDTSRAHADGSKIMESEDGSGITEVFERNGVVVGAILVGRNGDRPKITKLIQEKRSME